MEGKQERERGHGGIRGRKPPKNISSPPKRRVWTDRGKILNMYISCAIIRAGTSAVPLGFPMITSPVEPFSRGEAPIYCERRLSLSFSAPNHAGQSGNTSQIFGDPMVAATGVIRLWCCSKIIWAHRRQLVRGLPFRNKVDAGKSSLILNPKARIRPQCRVTTPLWAPGAVSGQRTKPEFVGEKFGPKK
jgi:hypothetical protein